MSISKRQQLVDALAWGTLTSKGDLSGQTFTESDILAYVASLDQFNWTWTAYWNPKLTKRQRNNLVASVLKRIADKDAERIERRREFEDRQRYEQTKEKYMQLALDAWIAGIEQLEDKPAAYSVMFSILYGYRANHEQSKALDTAVSYALKRSK